MKNPNVSLYHDTRRPLIDGTFPVKLSVTFRASGGRIRKLYPTGVNVTERDYRDLMDGSKRGDLPAFRRDVLRLETRANEIFDTAPFISDPGFFEAELNRTPKKSGAASVKDLYDELILKLQSADQWSTANSYRDSRESLTGYAGEGLTFAAVDPDFLEGYEKAMKTAKRSGDRVGFSPTTISIYLRVLRAVFNIAIARKLVNAELYPFGRKKYVIPSELNVKQALDEKDKTKLLRAKTLSAGETQALAAFTFSYYCNGMNFSDMAYLTSKNIKGDVLTFVRRKTETTKKRVEEIQVVIRPEVRNILKGLQAKNTDYIFGIIAKADDAKTKGEKVRQWIKTTNKFLGYISERIKIKRVTTYTARHTMATSLLRNNVNIVDIRDALGHSSVATTEKYLKGLNIEGKRTIARLL